MHRWPSGGWGARGKVFWVRAQFIKAFQTSHGSVTINRRVLDQNPWSYANRCQVTLKYSDGSSFRHNCAAGLIRSQRRVVELQCSAPSPVKEALGWGNVHFEIPINPWKQYTPGAGWGKTGAWWKHPATEVVSRMRVAGGVQSLHFGERYINVITKAVYSLSCLHSIPAWSVSSNQFFFQGSIQVYGAQSGSVPQDVQVHFQFCSGSKVILK